MCLENTVSTRDTWTELESRENINKDLINRLLLALEPAISSFRKTAYYMSRINAALWNAKTRRRETLVCERDQRILILVSNRNRDFSPHLNVVQLNVRKRHCVAWNLLLRHLWIFGYLSSRELEAPSTWVLWYSNVRYSSYQRYCGSRISRFLFDISLISSNIS